MRRTLGALAGFVWLGGSMTAAGHAAPSAGAPLVLATAGATRYCVVPPDQPSKADDYAVRTLADYLKQITGAEFPVGGRGVARKRARPLRGHERPSPPAARRRSGP